MLVRPVFVASLLVSTTVLAAPASIGIITASGHFTVEGSRIYGNSTLFDGARVETAEASSSLSLRNGVKVQLGANTVARVWQDRMEIDRGTGQVTAPAKFAIGAGSVTVSGQRFRVGVGERLEVAALTGNARILSSAGGEVLASIPSGRSMTFSMLQAIMRTGCLLYKEGGYILDVDESEEYIQITGPDLNPNVGRRVEVTGTPQNIPASISPATTVLAVSAVSPVSVGGCLTAAAAINAQTTVPGGAAPAKPVPGAQPPGAPKPVPTSAGGGGMSTGAKTAIILGVAGGGAAAAALALGGKDDTSQ